MKSKKPGKEMYLCVFVYTHTDTQYNVYNLTIPNPLKIHLVTTKITDLFLSFQA